MATPTPTHTQLEFLRSLLWFGRCVRVTDLPQTSQEQGPARQRCRHRGWATFENGCWVLTDEGRHMIALADGAA